MISTPKVLSKVLMGDFFDLFSLMVVTDMGVWLGGRADACDTYNAAVVDQDGPNGSKPGGDFVFTQRFRHVLCFSRVQ